MRKTEKFYENFNNLKVSPEQAAERFEFKDVKTLDGLSAKASKATEDLKKRIRIAIDDEILSDDAYDVHTVSDIEYENQKDKIEGLRRKYKSDIEKQEKLQQKLLDKTNKLFKKAQAIEDKALKSESSARAEKSKAEQLVDQMKSAIKTFESSAKALGVDVSGKISKYDSVMRKLDSATMMLK